MQPRFAHLLALAYVSLTWARLNIGDLKTIDQTRILPNRYIVELQSLADLGTRSEETVHSKFHRKLQSRGIHVSIKKEFNAKDVFVGASVSLKNPNDVEDLRKTPGVLAVHPVTIIPRPDPIIATSISDKDRAAADLQNTHVLTHVDKLHAEMVLGNGIKIGIIDTGTDYTHPALGGGFGPGHVIVGGTDLVGDNFNGTNTPVPDNDPLDQCVGHGTHVAGIIAAQPGNPFNITGVAYKSEIYSYRVFGCQGSTNDELVIDGLLQAYHDGMDVLTLSLGGPGGWTQTVSSRVANNIAKQGRVVTVAVGNAGADGAWDSESPSDGLNVISVASTDNTVVGAQLLDIEGIEHDPLPYHFSRGDLEPFTPPDGPGPYRLYATSTDPNNPFDACDPLPDDTPDLSNYVVLYQRGGCMVPVQFGNLAAKGAQYLLSWTPVDGVDSSGSSGLARRQVINTLYSMSLANNPDGYWLTTELAAGKNISVSFNETRRIEVPDPAGGLTSSFSSYGPTTDMFMKPSIGAPGGSILSTWLTNDGSYAVLSGTSMATPFMAGVSALLLQANGKGKAVALGARERLQTTAQPLFSNHSDTSLYQTLTQQGGGLVDAYKAVHAKTSITPGQLLLNDTQYFQGKQVFHVQNNGKKSQVYRIGHIPAGTAITYSDERAILGPVPLIANEASVAFSATSVMVPPGEKATITATFTPPVGLDPSTYPVYSGWITVASKSDVLQLPYVGAVGVLGNKDTIDPSADLFGFTTPTLIDRATGQPQDGPQNYTLVGEDEPFLLLRLAIGSPWVSLDLVSSNATLSDVKIIGNIDTEQYLARNGESSENPYYAFFINGTLSDGSVAPKGTYKVLLRSLHVNGDRQKKEDYDSWLSPIIGLGLE